MTEFDDTEEYDLRGLVMSGGRPYILITVTDPETGECKVDHAGFGEDLDLALALQEVALLLADA